MREKLEQILTTYDALTAHLGDPAVLSDQKEYARLAKEHRAQTPLAEKAREYVGLLDERVAQEAGLQDMELRITAMLVSVFRFPAPRSARA